MFYPYATQYVYYNDDDDIVGDHNRNKNNKIIKIN